MKLTTKALNLAGAAALATIGLSSLASAAPVSVTTKPNGAIQVVAKPGSTITTNNKGVIKVTANHSITRIATNDHGVTTVTVRKVEPAPVTHFRYGYDDRRYDWRHKPPARFEHRPNFARFFHPGHWDFRFGHWMWIGGHWTR